MTPATSEPGAWMTVKESMSARAAAYQEQITGQTGTAYKVNGVKFDGYTNGTLQEAKGPGYAKFVKDGEFPDWFRGSRALAEQAKRQVQAAGSTPIPWSVAEAPAVAALNNLFSEYDVLGINVVYVAPSG